MRFLSLILVLLLLGILGVGVLLYGPFVPEVPTFLDEGSLVVGVLGLMLSLFITVFLLARFFRGGRENLLPFVWALSFLGLALSSFVMTLRGLCACDADSVCIRIFFILGENFWATGMLAGALFILSPENSRRWVVLPLLFFVASIATVVLVSEFSKTPEVLLVVNGFFFITPVLALVAHSFFFYMKVSKSTFARLIATGLGFAIAFFVTRAVIMEPPFIHFVNILLDISLVFMLTGFIFMRFETELREQE